MAFVTDGAIGISLATTSTDSRAKLGERHTADNGQVYVYVKASAAINQYDCVAIDNSFNATGMTKTLADLGRQPGVAQVAFASAEYGWVAIHGQGLTVTVLGSCDKGVALFTTATTGVLDDATGSQTRLWGVVLVNSAGTTGTTSVTANLVNPHATLSPTPFP